MQKIDPPMAPRNRQILCWKWLQFAKHSPKKSLLTMQFANIWETKQCMATHTVFTGLALTMTVTLESLKSKCVTKVPDSQGDIVATSLAFNKAVKLSSIQGSYSSLRFCCNSPSTWVATRSSRTILLRVAHELKTSSNQPKLPKRPQRTNSPQKNTTLSTSSSSSSPLQGISS